jgi:hypothetical protein
MTKGPQAHDELSKVMVIKMQIITVYPPKVSPPYRGGEACATM